MNPEIWRLMSDAIEEPIFLHDAEYCLLLANRAYFREAGMSAAEALGKPYWEVFPRGAGPLPGCRQALDEGRTESTEQVKAGERFFVSRGYPVRDDAGGLLYSLHILCDITEQRKAAEALAESEAHLRSATEYTRDAIITLDGESGAVATWNRAAEAIFGYSKEETIGRVLHDILAPPRFREAARVGMAHFATTGEGAAVGKTLELAALHKNGTEFPIELSLSAMQLNGKWYATGIARDITERKKTESELRETRDYLGNLLDYANAPIIVWDPSFRIAMFNHAFERLTGRNATDVIGKEIDILFPPDRRDEALAHIRRTKEGERWEEIEMPILHSSGEVRTTLWNSATLYSADGKDVLSTIAQGQDITERRQAETALRDSEAQLRTVVENLTEGLAVSDLDGNLLHFNRAALEMHGFTTQDECCRHLNEFSDTFELAAMDGTIWPVEQWPLARILRGENLCGLEARIRNIKAGWQKIFSYGGALVRDDGGQPLMAVVTASDITERKQAERHLARLNCMYRTISLCNQALMRAQDELELCRQMCRVLVEEGGFRAAWVGYAEQGANKRIQPVTVAGITLDEIEDMKISWGDDERGQGPTGTVVRTGNIVVSQDIRNDPLWAPWHEQAGRLGLAAASTFPLQVNGRVIGALDIYGAEADAFAPDMLELLAELAGDLAFGIGNLRSRAERMGILEKLELSLDHAVTAIAATVEMRDPYTAGHQRRVAKLATAIAQEMELEEGRVEGLRMAGVVHDIGKIHVPAEILSNPGKLTEAEFEIIKTHSQAGYEILKGIDFPWPVAEIVWQHHEKLDGSGYPRGLKGEELLLEARILTVADVVEAMTSHRPYRPGFGVFPSLQEISRNKGKLYDERAVEACLRLFMEKGFEL